MDEKTTPVRRTDVHTAHCCARHGCKYGAWQGPCTVVDGGEPQEYPCEFCCDEIEELWELIQAMNQLFDAGRRAAAQRVLSCVQGGPEHPWIPGAAFRSTGLLGDLRRWSGER